MVAEVKSSDILCLESSFKNVKVMAWGEICATNNLQ